MFWQATAAVYADLDCGCSMCHFFPVDSNAARAVRVEYSRWWMNPRLLCPNEHLLDHIYTV